MSGSGFSNSELGSRSRVKHLHHASRNSQTLFPNEVESRSHTEKDVLMCVFVRALTLTKAHARRMETNIKRMWGGRILIFLSCDWGCCAEGAVLVLKWKRNTSQRSAHTHSYTVTVTWAPFVFPFPGSGYSSIPGHGGAGPWVHVFPPDVHRKWITHLTLCLL